MPKMLINTPIFMHNYRYYRTKLSVVFSAYFEENKLIHQYNTRHKDDFHTNVVASEFGKRAITYKGSKLWNSLPSHIKDTPHSGLLNLLLKIIYCSLWYSIVKYFI